MFLKISAVLFLAYFGSVTFGAMGNKPLMSDLSEMILLLATSIIFVIGILQEEQKASKNRN